MLKVKSGDLEKLGLLYERYKKRLFAFLFKMNGDVALSEDLVQNVFMKMLKYRHTFQGNGKFINWMFHIAKNVNNDHFRKYGNHSTSEEMMINSLEASECNDAESKLLNLDQSNTLQRALKRMPVAKRELLVLSKERGLSIKDIAEIYGSTEGAIKVKVHRALKELRSLYFEMENS